MDNLNIPLLELIGHFPGHLYWKDLEGVYRGCNLEMVHAIGLNQREDLIGKTDFDIVDKVEALRLRELDAHVVRTGSIYTAEEVVLLKNQERTFFSKKAPLRDINGDVIGIIGTSVDITSQKQTEEALRREKRKAEQASQIKSDFIANMSHDLRTPLSGMQALAEDIILKTQDEDVSKNASLLLQASRDLLNLIDDILQVSRLDSGKEEHGTARAFMLAPLVHNTLSIMRPKAFERSIKLTLTYDDSLPEEVVGDHLVLQRILVNLLSNALKFTAENGFVDVRIKLKCIVDSRCYIDFFVDDTGIGIPADKLDFIFEKFSRVAASFQSQYTGSGMGLYMVKHYIEQMGGEIDVMSQEGQGSQFHCVIPFELSHHKVETQQKLPLPFMDLEEPQLEKPHVLVVEDNKIAQHSQLNKLRDANCEVILAENAAEALSYFEQFRFDLLLVDLGLPDMDGLTLIQQFRKQHDNPNHVCPMILLTAHAAQSDLEKSQVSGVTELLIKPLMTEHLKRLLKAYVVC